MQYLPMVAMFFDRIYQCNVTEMFAFKKDGEAMMVPALEPSADNPSFVFECCHKPGAF
jgi:hypothetical protein